MESAFLPFVSAQLDSSPVLRVAAGTVLWRRGTYQHEVSYLQTGRVAFGLLESNPAQLPALEHYLGMQAEPGWMDAASAVLSLVAATDALAETDVLLRTVPLPQFVNALAQADPAFTQVLRDVAQTSRQQTEWAVSRLAKDAEARCAEWLLRRAAPSSMGGATVQLAQRKRTIAAELGMAPETLSRVLRQLRERKLISGTGRNVQLVDTRGLGALANG
ncbi:Crp/Fnr family transcriptional regulator [Rhodoferax sp.]|uniref:Crp/Fnr family transcriptional regulator n=1 Tax=Rhodoferax sp. TaxID=50421 RepID=UPI002ACED5A2|nr:Crp/Fnr family transcriptional regulator [Rhodoferax sp.]MDZ7919862.1 Crp/Fnr family transcriptional regulator [Rhodoferax sp.]